MIKKVLLVFALFIPFSIAGADNVIGQPVVDNFVKSLTWLQDPVVQSSIQKQNEAHESLTQEQINELDQQWRKEAKAGNGELIDSVLSNDLSSYLKDVQSNSDGLYTEIFVMDDKGLNVGQSGITSDYYQGDEAKWQKTYQVGPDAVHVSDIDLDDSTQRLQSQVSVPVVDGAGNVIGAVTFGVDVDLFLEKFSE